MLTCPTCRQSSRHPPNKMLGRWAICPHCGGEIDWRALTPVGEALALTDEPFPTPKRSRGDER